MSMNSLLYLQLLNYICLHNLNDLKNDCIIFLFEIAL